MTNAEAIEYIKKNCYGEWCEDDWREAMDMAIEALKCSETPKSSERTSETAQADHIADIGKKVDGDCIGRQAAIDALARMMPRSYMCTKCNVISIYASNFCPNCGADMRKENES